MAIQTILNIASSALDAQSERITLIAQNLANADSAAASGGGPYQREVPVFETIPVAGQGGTVGLGVKVAAVLHDPAAPKIVYDPGNPLADASGNVKEPAVNPLLEMVDLLEASRSYQANLSTLETARTVALRTIDLLK